MITETKDSGIEKKIKNMYKICGGLTLFSFLLVGKINYNDFKSISSLSKQEVVKQYSEVIKTLYNLKTELGYMKSGINKKYPYLTDEIKANLKNTDEYILSGLEKSIEIAQKDSLELTKNPKVQELVKNKEAVGDRLLQSLGIVLAPMGSGLLYTLYLISRERKKNKNK